MKVTSKIVLAILLTVSLAGNVLAGSKEDANMKLIGNFAKEVFVDKNLSSADQYIKADYIQHNPLVSQGVKGFKEFFGVWFDSVPDWNYTVKKIIANGDEVWVYGTYAGTLTKDWLGIPAADQKYAFDAVDIFRIQDNKLAEHWDVMDIYVLFKQLGVIK